MFKKYSLSNLILASITAMLLLVSCSIRADNLPDLGSSERSVFSQAEEAKMGNQYMQYLRSSGNVVEDPIDQQYINNLGNELVSSSNQPSGHFYFFFMASPEINSFAGPDGYIAVYSGLMQATTNEEELASVMAHEIAHVTQGHIARKIAQASNQKYKTLAGMLAAIALGTVSGQAAEAAIITTAAGSQQSMLNFSREMESEADRVGISTLAKAGFNPNSMVDFFQRLQQSERYYMKMPALLSDHPLTPERISDAENRAAQYSPRHHKTSQKYYLIKERLRIITSSNNHALISYYKKLLNDSKSKHRFALQYGYALALQNNQQFAQAQPIMDKLVNDYPDQLIFQIGAADIAIDAGNPTKAIKIMQPAHELYPDSYPAMVEYATALYKAKKYSEALNTLRLHHLNYPDDPIPYSLLSNVQAKAGKKAEAYQTRALYLTQYGAFKAALAQLQIALQLPKIDSATKSRIKSQMKGIEQQMQAEK